MKFEWTDYNEAYIDLVESWIDDEARHMTGLDDGWHAHYEYYINQEYTKLGENTWYKIVLNKGIPFASIALALTDEGKLCIMEYIVAPNRRRKGYGSAALQELLDSSEKIIGRDFISATAVIFPINEASKRAFEHAGFTFESAHPDGDAWYYTYYK